MDSNPYGWIFYAVKQTEERGSCITFSLWFINLYILLKSPHFPLHQCASWSLFDSYLLHSSLLHRSHFVHSSVLFNYIFNFPPICVPITLQHPSHISLITHTLLSVFFPPVFHFLSSPSPLSRSLSAPFLSLALLSLTTTSLLFLPHFIFSPLGRRSCGINMHMAALRWHCHRVCLCHLHPIRVKLSTA